MKKCLSLETTRKDKFRAKVKVSDDWFPNLPGNFVAMYFTPKTKENNYTYISIWGDDDFGMIKYNGTLEEFNMLKNKVISQKMCKEMGFVLD